MSTAANHSKRSHRSHRRHYGQGKILRSRIAAGNNKSVPLLARLAHRLKAKILPKAKRLTVGEEAKEA